MKIKQEGSMDFSFKNPFDDFNANVLNPEQIMQYWYTPFATGALKEFDEKKFFAQKMPIILQGSRGSGKTTILKYFSFPVQKERANQRDLTIKEQLLVDGGVGFYFRCDYSFLKEFENVFRIANPEKWTLCFEHYLELFFTRNLLDFIKDICGESNDRLQDEVIKLAELSGLQTDEFLSMAAINQYINSEISYINMFKNDSLFKEIDFMPKHIWSLYDISVRLIRAISAAFPELSQMNYLLLIDEFENLPLDLQKLFNTIIKFCHSDVSMRVGRRSENIVTTETINNVEYLREKHDYCLIVLDQDQNIQSMKKYLAGIARRRLEAFEGLSLSHNIIDLFDDMEDLDSECSSIADSRNLHLIYILKSNPRIASDQKNLDEIISIISYPENRIAEMINALWVARCANGDDLFSVAHEAVDAMNAFFQKKKHPKLSKYKNDYSNKYRYALTIFLCTAYRKDKSYYSFNTICYLSEGNTRTFINLCRAIISDALFYEKDSFISTGRVSVESQSRAIRGYSLSEFESVCSIIQYGNSIRNFILALGNIFSEYHKDHGVRYPETNQFSYNPDSLLPEAKDILNIAISWSLIKRRRGTQRISAGIAKEDFLYSINKIFSPIFNISYRTRGGVNVVLSSDDIQLMLKGEPIRSFLSTPGRKAGNASKLSRKNPPYEQVSIFDEGES